MNTVAMSIKQLSFIGLFLFCLSGIIGPAISLLLGLSFTLVFSNPYLSITNEASKWLLKIAVIGLGFNVNFNDVLEVGRSSIVLTIVSITAIIGLGEIFGQLFKVKKKISVLISFGTAICGGSAIAAMAPVIRAKQHEIAVSLAIIFLLNGVALIVFPAVGHYFGLTEKQFALWAALAIHDTSSVVATASTYGPLAVGIATTIKLTRAMWIIPYTALAGAFWKSEEKASIPLFIVGFLLTALINTYFPEHWKIWQSVYLSAKHLLYACLFLIGASVSMSMMKQTGWRPLFMASVLWVIVSSVILILILDGAIK